jgi:uncharacterized membrane protein
MRGPERLLLAVGIVVGLAFALLYPPWAAGADEATHFARALEMAHRRITPGEVDGQIASRIPSSYQEDENGVILVLFKGGPFDRSAFDRLGNSRPDWAVTTVVETQPTLAATPIAYAPSALAMVIPDRLGWAGVWVLWAGRLGNLLVYLALAWFAVRIATAFRWTLAIAALFPMNLGIAASVTPDALTIAAFLLMMAVWTRVWRPRGVGPTGPTGVAATVDDEPIGGRSPRGLVVRIGDWTRTPRGTFAMVLASGLLLVATKPPYFLMLAAFPALLVTAWRDRRLRASALAGAIGLAAGALFTLLTSSGSYKAVTSNIAGSVNYQPDVQQERLLSDPVGFLHRVTSDWFGHLDVTVQRWVRHAGAVEVRMPSWSSWVFLLLVVVAAMTLDRRDLLGLRRIPRAIWVLAAPALGLALYVSSYLYFDDTVEGTYMGLQIHRYVAPLFAAALVGWAPRFVLRVPLSAPWSRRIPVWVPVGMVVLAELVMIVAAVRTWSVVGWSVDVS